MNTKEIIETLQIAKAEVEWNYPLDYYIAIEEAVNSLNAFEKMKKKVLEWYKSPQNPYLQEEINEISCANCYHRTDNRECPLENVEKCIQTDEETMDIFIEELLKNES